jgi:hypothetical protein
MKRYAGAPHPISDFKSLNSAEHRAIIERIAAVAELNGNGDEVDPTEQMA